MSELIVTVRDGSKPMVRQRIIWRTWGRTTTTLEVPRPVTDEEKEDLRRQLQMFGWTPPRWWQWWRWRDTTEKDIYA